MSYNTRTLGKRIAALSLVIGLLAGTFLPSPGVLYAETPDSSSVVDAGEPLLIGADGAVSDAMDVLSSVTSALSESTSSAAQSASSSDSTESESAESVSSESVSASSVSEPASDSASVPESNAEDSSMSEGSEPADSDSAVSSSMSASVSESASAVQSESVSAADSASTENDTVDEADEPFNALAVLDPKPGHDIKAKVGDEITLTSGVNRDDVVVSYQWQRMQLSMPKEETVQEEIVPLFDYDEASPTWYSYPLTDMTEYELLQANPDAAWQGVELYKAAVDAFDAIGEDTASLTFAWRTPNYVLDGYSISAERVDDVVRIYADKDDRRYTAVPNAEGAYEFSAESSEYTVDELLTNVWEDIEGATEPAYTFTVSEADLYATYRLAVKIEDETYLAAVCGMLEESDMVLSDEQESAEQVLYSVVINLSEDVPSADSLTIEDTVDGRDSLVSMFSAVSTPKLSADGRWIEGLNGSYQYITKDTYDRVTAWYKNGEITKQQYNYYWTYLNPNGFSGFEYTNILDENGRPTGETRKYNGFDLVEGNKLEVASEWYGKTVLFRIAGTNSITEIKIPAYTELYGNGDKYEESSAGSTYKKNVVFLNPYVKDTGPMYASYLKTVSDANGWLIAMDGSRMDIHVSMYTVDAESFNADPQRYMVDAEGNYRVDAVGWGVCTNLEPDLSGKAYWALKDFIANGYGFLTGHDTMYAYAGAYYDAHGGADLDESSIDPNDGTTWYYDRNSWQPGTTATSATGDKSATRGGHFYMNELMGTNAGNVYSGTVDPSDAPSKILSAGGSNGHYGKNVLFGTETLNVVQTGYSAQQAASNPRYRTPTNYPFSYTAGTPLSVAYTHTNEQVAFGPVWINYYGTNKGHADHGFYADPMTWYLDGMAGTNNFYLSGDGNYLMNQVGHLPENSASKDEAALFVNSIMYVSQRKQCEICAANQGHQTSHFVHRVSVSNADAVLKALQQGGTYWYPIDGCYQLVDDIQLPDDWTPIAGFKGHWNSDVYDVTLGANGQPLLKNDSADGESGWNLGTNSEQGTVNVFNSAGVRTTGVARVVGDLNDLFGTSGVNYTGYVVKILGSDNPSHMGSSEVYACTVNTDSKYVISNLPCVYDDQERSGVLTARVYDTNGKEVTEYGSVHVNVSESFWNTDMTTPLDTLCEILACKVEDILEYIPPDEN